MFADEYGIFLQRSRSTVGEVITDGAGADEDQLIAPVIGHSIGTTLLPWGARHWKKIFDQFSGDPLPYGLNDINRTVVGTLARFLHEQKLIERQPELDPLFIAPDA